MMKKHNENNERVQQQINAMSDFHIPQPSVVVAESKLVDEISYTAKDFANWARQTIVSSTVMTGCYFLYHAAKPQGRDAPLKASWGSLVAAMFATYCLTTIATAPKAPPSARAPTSPIKTVAG